MIRRLLPTVAAFAALSACQGDPEQREQWVVSVSTDAQLPRFGDRLLLEILREDGTLFCSSCRRSFDASDPTAFPLSFGIVPTDGGERLLVRARLHRAIYVGSDGLPAGPTLIDASGYLPTTPGRVNLTLPMACFGRGDDDPLTSCSDGSPGPAPELSSATLLPTPGTWPPGRNVECPGTAPEGMVCVPGGAFLLGSFDAPPTPGDIGLVPLPERLVQVSPFFMDIDEVQVRDVRAMAAQLPSKPTPQGASTDPRVDCTYRDDGQTDALPVNCVDRSLAALICQGLGGRLPTEAEWEYAASAGGVGPERNYPWGDDEDVCAKSVVSTGATGNPEQDRSCLAGDKLILPGLREGGHAGDRSPLGIANLAGNVAEWLEDDFATYDAPCWQDAPLLDPTCRIVGSNSAGVRGGSWTLSRIFAHSSSRKVQKKTTRLPSIGLRCARSIQ